VGTEGVRSSDRIYLELPIVLTGADAAGREFREETRTLVVNRRGAKIVSRHSLVPGQKLHIRCLKSGRESDLRVAGHIGGDEEGYHYGIEVLNAGTDFWGIRFPLLTPAAKAASRVLLECSRCQAQEVAHLDVFELEVLLANECLMRFCDQCRDSTLWMPPVPGGGSPEMSKPPSPSNVSRGGFRFRSARDYAVATLIEAALPYVPGAANIFAPARIVYRDDHPTEGTRAYGVAYVPTHMASSLTGMRISTPE
jgi:hypothetical protein